MQHPGNAMEFHEKISQNTKFVIQEWIISFQSFLGYIKNFCTREKTFLLSSARWKENTGQGLPFSPRREQRASGSESRVSETKECLCHLI